MRPRRDDQIDQLSLHFVSSRQGLPEIRRRRPPVTAQVSGHHKLDQSKQWEEAVPLRASEESSVVFFEFDCDGVQVGTLSPLATRVPYQRKD
jgi:hypothetical protein